MVGSVLVATPGLGLGLVLVLVLVLALVLGLEDAVISTRSQCLIRVSLTFVLGSGVELGSEIGLGPASCIRRDIGEGGAA